MKIPKLAKSGLIPPLRKTCYCCGVNPDFDLYCIGQELHYVTNEPRQSTGGMVKGYFVVNFCPMCGRKLKEE